MDLQKKALEIRSDLERARREFGKRIVGNEHVFEFIIKALLARGHVLLEGLPGLGKTLMVKTISEILSLRFSRVQFTPDLMPADIIGTNLLVEDDTGRRHFEFERGPIFTNVLLADEINRASPKTQSALLQAMEEREATVFGESHRLEAPFLVLATQNPIEMAGTYPLPEAQLDRFLFKLSLSSPSRDALKEIARRNVEQAPAADEVEKVLGLDDILAIQEFLYEIPVTARIYDFASEVVYLSSPGSPGAPETVRKFVKYGASPRGLNALLAASRVSALLAGRFNLAVEDLRANLLECLRHRLILNFEGEVEMVGPDAVLTALFDAVAERY